MKFLIGILLLNVFAVLTAGENTNKTKWEEAGIVTEFSYYPPPNKFKMNFKGKEVNEGNTFTTSEVETVPNFPWDSFDSYRFYTIGIWGLDTTGKGNERYRQTDMWTKENVPGSEFYKHEGRTITSYRPGKNESLIYVCLVWDQKGQRNIITRVYPEIRIFNNYLGTPVQGNFWRLSKN